VRHPGRVTLREVGPRDGIQSERAAVTTAQKIELIDALSATGLTRIEATSFVSPRAVPQMADAAAVLAGIIRRDGVVFSALVPNRAGAERALEARADALQVFIAATDEYNLANVRKTVRDSLSDVAEVASVGLAARVPVEGTISTAFGCPYSGDVEPARVVEVARAMLAAGIDTVSLGDTTGMATPRRVADVVEAARAALPEVSLNMHFHDTRGTGLANVVAALGLDIDYFDSSIGGLGGSPFARGATGNIATEDLVHMLEDMGVATGVDLEALLEAAALAERILGRELPGKLLRAGPRTAVATDG
jgi:hydroxymethylglutaryl-CoA lyase